MLITNILRFLWEYFCPRLLFVIIYAFMRIFPYSPQSRTFADLHVHLRAYHRKGRFADGNIEAVQGKPIDEQGDEGFFGTSSRSSNQERGYPPPSNPRLDGGRIYTAMQKYPSFIHRPALGWTVAKRVFSIQKTNKKCTRSLLS